MALRELVIDMVLKSNVKKEIDDVNNTVDKSKSKFEGLGSAMQAIAAIGFGAMMKSFADKAIEASNQAENAIIGFQTVVKNTLGVGKMTEAEQGVKQLFDKLGGSMDMSSIQMSVKNLLNTGFDLSQALSLIENNAYMASVNRQSHYKTIGEAVQVYTEGIKNNNAMLTDSTGISENLSVTLKKQGLKMDDLNNESKKGAVIQAIYNGHVKEASVYKNAFTTQMEGFQGQSIKVNSQLKQMTAFAGDLIKYGFLPIFGVLGPVLEYFSHAENGLGRLRIVAIALTPVLLFLALSSMGSMVKSIYDMTKAIQILGINFYVLLGWLLAIGAAIAAVYLVLEDLFIFQKYGLEGSETVIGRLLQKWGYNREE